MALQRRTLTRALAILAIAASTMSGVLAGATGAAGVAHAGSGCAPAPCQRASARMGSERAQRPATTRVVVTWGAAHAPFNPAPTTLTAHVGDDLVFTATRRTLIAAVTVCGPTTATGVDVSCPTQTVMQAVALPVSDSGEMRAFWVRQRGTVLVTGYVMARCRGICPRVALEVRVTVRAI